MGKISTYLQERMDQNQIPGLSIVVLQDGKVVWQAGYGEAAPGVATTPATAFMLGSLSKSFTALAVSQLLDAGKISLQTPYQQYVPEFNMHTKEAAAHITVADLLVHRSGLTQQHSYSTSRRKQTLEERVQRLQEAELASAPGTSFHYANINYALLGLLVERVSGTAYGDYLQQHVFVPLQMKNSAAQKESIAASTLSAGYRLWFGWPVAATLPYPADNLPSGHLYASAADLGHYLQMLQNGGRYGVEQLISKEQLHATFLPPDTSFYARGWITGEIQGVPAIYHGGAVANYNTFMALDPEGKWAYAVLMNVNSFVAGDAIRTVAEGVVPLLEGKAPPVQQFTATKIYIVVNVLVGLWLFFFLRGMYTKYREVAVYLWEEMHLTSPSPKAWWKPLLADVVPAVLVVVGIPLYMGLDWRQMALSQPDLVYLLLAVLFISFFSGVFMAYIRFAAAQKWRYHKKATA